MFSILQGRREKRRPGEVSRRRERRRQKMPAASRCADDLSRRERTSAISFWFSRAGWTALACLSPEKSLRFADQSQQRLLGCRFGVIAEGEVPLPDVSISDHVGRAFEKYDSSIDREFGGGRNICLIAISYRLGNLNLREVIQQVVKRFLPVRLALDSCSYAGGECVRVIRHLISDRLRKQRKEVHRAPVLLLNRQIQFERLGF